MSTKRKYKIKYDQKGQGWITDLATGIIKKVKKVYDTVKPSQYFKTTDKWVSDVPQGAYKFGEYVPFLQPYKSKQQVKPTEDWLINERLISDYSRPDGKKGILWQTGDFLEQLGFKRKRQSTQKGKGVYSVSKKVLNYLKNPDVQKYGLKGLAYLRNTFLGGPKVSGQEVFSHAILRDQNGKLVNSSYMGPGTEMWSKLKNNVSHTNPKYKNMPWSDIVVSKAHDLRYSKARNFEDVKYADRMYEKGMKKLKDEKKDSNFNIALGRYPILAKNKIEEFSGIDITKKVGAGYGDYYQRSQEDQKIADDALMELEQMGFKRKKKKQTGKKRKTTTKKQKGKKGKTKTKSKTKKR